jgi:GntR family transcriptional regulator
VSEPVTRRITDDLRRQISNGTLGPGALLPSEPELARQYEVSRQTARTALRALEQEGLVAVRPRRGRIVRSHKRLRWRLSEFEHPDTTATATTDAWTYDITAQGHDASRQDLEVATIAPPAAVAARLDLDPDTDLCVVRRRLRYIDQHPALTCDDYFDEAIVRDTELARPEPTPREDILKEAGYEQTYDIDEITARMPSQNEIARLQLTPGTPIAEHIRTGYTPNDKAVRVMVSIVPGDTLMLQYIVAT